MKVKQIFFYPITKSQVSFSCNEQILHERKTVEISLCNLLTEFFCLGNKVILLVNRESL